MKVALVVIALLALVGLSMLLLVDDFRVRRQLSHERQQVSNQISKAQSEVLDKMQAASNQLVAARTELVRLNNELVFPIHITQKKAATGNGYVVQIFNNSEQPLPVAVTYSNTVSKKTKTFEFDLSPGFSRDISRLEGWTAVSGDTLHVVCPGFMPVKRALK